MNVGVNHAETVLEGGRLQRWWGVLGPWAVLVWAASHQSWAWVGFSALALGLGVGRFILSPRRQSQLARLTIWIAGTVLLGLGVVALYTAIRWVTQDLVIAALVLAMAFVPVTLGLLVLWPAKTMPVLHIQTRSGSGRYRGPEPPAGPNDVLSS
jgi:hypothetical protein